jgi:hypothetical protein
VSRWAQTQLQFVSCWELARPQFVSGWAPTLLQFVSGWELARLQFVFDWAQTLLLRVFRWVLVRLRQPSFIQLRQPLDLQQLPAMPRAFYTCLT